MRITGVRAYQVDLPLREGTYNWSGGKSVSVFDSTVIEVLTDGGISGWGEVCPLGPFYLPAYAAGVRAGVAELGPHLIGYDPCELGVLNQRMDAALQGGSSNALMTPFGKRHPSSRVLQSEDRGLAIRFDPRRSEKKKRQDAITGGVNFIIRVIHKDVPELQAVATYDLSIK